jgi:tRNA(Ile2) C34 agmatinyltransferase TiaS
MAQKKAMFNVEISDVFEDEQEDLVIEKVVPFLKESADELREHFKTTDTIEVRRISEAEAKTLCSELEGKDLAVRMYSIGERQKERVAEQIRCPKCKAVLDSLDWRCPECYYEFPEYEFTGDEDE